MAKIAEKNFNKMSLPQPIARMNALPLDATEIFYSREDAEKYSTGDATAYVGQLVRVVNPDNGAVTLYVITGVGQQSTLLEMATASSLATLKSELQQSLSEGGFQGSLMLLLENPEQYGKPGMEFVATAEAIERLEAIAPQSDLELEVGDYLIVLPTFKPGTVRAEDFVVLEHNLTGAVTSVEGGVSETGKYVSGVVQEGSQLKVQKEALPPAPIMLIDSIAIRPEIIDRPFPLRSRPYGPCVLGMLNGVSLKPGDFTFDAEEKEVTPSTALRADLQMGDNLTFVYISLS